MKRTSVEKCFNLQKSLFFKIYNFCKCCIFAAYPCCWLGTLPDIMWCRFKNRCKQSERKVVSVDQCLVVFVLCLQYVFSWRQLIPLSTESEQLNSYSVRRNWSQVFLIYVTDPRRTRRKLSQVVSQNGGKSKGFRKSFKNCVYPNCKIFVWHVDSGEKYKKKNSCMGTVL